MPGVGVGTYGQIVSKFATTQPTKTQASRHDSPRLHAQSKRRFWEIISVACMGNALALMSCDDRTSALWLRIRYVR
jgi:hypothetical protein